MDKGVDILNPLSLDMGDEVNIDQISGKGVKIYPGCRIYGDKTVISKGSEIGIEGPVTIDNCQLGPEVTLKGGYFQKAVFLKGAGMGMGAHVREGCILEEQASGAHCVGLKQTILFPFVTLGSLINFCDCFMAGGTSRKNHSEVGSSYIHFNFTANGDKTTPSLFGEVPRGVMLDQPPIFLGGQGGAVGPLRLGYGNVTAAGTIIRKDVPENGRMIIGKTHRGGEIPFVPGIYTGLKRIIENNILYLGNLMALEQWYIHVRKSFLESREMGSLIFKGAIENLSSAKTERKKRLLSMAEKLNPSDGKNEFRENAEKICRLFDQENVIGSGEKHRNLFLKGIQKAETNVQYIQMIQGLPADIVVEGTTWLDQIIEDLCRKASAILPAMNLFRNKTKT
jgi:bifunctional UDP-N-acetylglucosamine pyrophosphorylase/glucosamine-1-phosphate N-acetyltransferase